MKRLIALCDGTWNTLDGRRTGFHKTNVALLEKHAIAKADGAIEQRVQYFPGIGTDETRNAFFTMLDQAWDAAFGGGMNEKIIQAYTWIAKHYARQLFALSCQWVTHRL